MQIPYHACEQILKLKVLINLFIVVGFFVYRLRITLTAAHTPSDVNALAVALAPWINKRNSLPLLGMFTLEKNSAVLDSYSTTINVTRAKL